MKRWYQSKTMWFNIASLAVAVAGVGLVYVDQLNLDTSQTMAVAMLFTGAQTIGNLYLRSITSAAIK